MEMNSHKSKNIYGQMSVEKLTFFIISITCKKEWGKGKGGREGRTITQPTKYQGN
jgi:hypothetical protein